MDRLEKAGAILIDRGVENILDEMNLVNERATFPNVEASHVFREQMKPPPDSIDPFIRSRIKRGMSVDAAHYIWMMNERKRLRDAMDDRPPCLQNSRTWPLWPLILARDPNQPFSFATCFPVS